MQVSTFAQAVATLRSHRASHTNDIAKCLTSSPRYGFSLSVHDAGAAYGVDWCAVFALPQKQVMRAIQFVSAVSRKSYVDFDYTHARILCAMKLAGSHDLNTDAICALAGATFNPDANTRGISRDNLNRMFASRHGASTIQTKMSNSTGKNGFYQSIGLTFAKPDERNHTVSLNDTHDLVIAFFDAINKATTGQIDDMKGTEE